MAAIDVTHLEEADGGPEPTRNGVDPPPRARAASVIPGSTSRLLPARPSLSARKLSLQERPAGSYLEAQAGPYATGPASHISPRAWRRPTIESHHVAISDAEVGGAARGVVQSPSVDCSEDSFLPLSVPHSYLALVCIPSELGRSLPNSIGSSQPGELQLSQRLRSLSPAVPTPSLGLGNRSRPGPLCSLLRDVKIEAMFPLPPQLFPSLHPSPLILPPRVCSASETASLAPASGLQLEFLPVSSESALRF